MSQPVRVLTGALPERIRAGLGRRSSALVLALLAEVLLGLLFLTLGSSNTRQEEAEPPLVSFDARPPVEKPPAPRENKVEDTKPAEFSAPRPAETRQPPPPSAVSSPPPMIQLSRDQMVSAEIAPAPSTKPRMGPPDTGTPGDTPQVGGKGPNGEPLYAAAWYRRPSDGELSGYLSTATGPGWGLIACRTVPDFRVEDCIALDEYPQGSNITRSVLAAAWQFRVRPPQLGGRSMVGQWVRIRIDYDLRH